MASHLYVNFLAGAADFLFFLPERHQLRCADRHEGLNERRPGCDTQKERAMEYCDRLFYAWVSVSGH